jgi:hypothetical protein
MIENVPAPDAVKSESTTPATVAVETAKSASQEQTTPEAAKAADGNEQIETEKEELTPAQLARKQRNQEKWRAMKEERFHALSEAERLRSELARIRNTKVDLSQYDDPDDALAARTAQKVRESFAGDYEQQAQRHTARADQAVVEAWSAIKDDARERMPDFDSVVTDTTPIHARAAPFIVESDKAAEIAYYLGKNIEAARDLYNEFERNPARALIKLGQIEANVSKPSPKAHSSAPKPAPILSGSSSPPAFDPKSAGVSEMQALLKKAGILG